MTRADAAAIQMMLAVIIVALLDGAAQVLWGVAALALCVKFVVLFISDETGVRR